MIGKMTAALGGAFALPLQIINIVWQCVLGMGLLKICLKLLDQKPVNLPDLWSTMPLALDYILVKLLIGLIVTIGLILLVIPGLIWSMQYYLASYLVVDRKLRPMAALRTSSQITSGAKWDLGIFASLVLLINFVGLMFAGIGLMVTVPVTMIASLHVYRQLLSQSEAANPIQ
jgi:uncharacterized membrane protein